MSRMMQAGRSKASAEVAEALPENIAEFSASSEMDDRRCTSSLLDIVKEVEQSNVFNIETREPVANYEYDPERFSLR